MCDSTFIILSSLYTRIFRSVFSAVYNTNFMHMRFELSPGISNSNVPYANMPIPFSVDLRWQIVWLHLSTNFTTDRIAQIMSVSERTVWHYISLFKRTGDVQPRKRRNGPRMLMGDFEQVALLRHILENPGLYLQELQDHLLSVFGVLVSVPTINL